MIYRKEFGFLVLSTFAIVGNISAMPQYEKCVVISHPDAKEELFIDAEKIDLSQVDLVQDTAEPSDSDYPRIHAYVEGYVNRTDAVAKEVAPIQDDGEFRDFLFDCERDCSQWRPYADKDLAKATFNYKRVMDKFGCFEVVHRRGNSRAFGLASSPLYEWAFRRG